MKIAGLQKVSTVDYPGEICCVVFLWGCNFRCGFCYNPELVLSGLESGVDGLESEIGFSQRYVLDFLSKRVGKLDAVCISGGEALLTLDMEFVRKIKEMGFKVKLDTNGSFPERLREIIDLGLVDYVAMDVKGAREDYEDIVGVKVCLEDIERSMKIVDDFGKGSFCTRINTDKHGFGKKESEFRTTVVEGLHDSERLVRMGEWINGVCGGNPERIFLQGFKRNGEGMIDSSFMEKDNFLEGDLIKLKKEIEGLFGEVGVRC